MEGQPSPSLRSKEAVWQELVLTNAEKALAVWINSEAKRSRKKPRYASDFNIECVTHNPDWKVFLYHNVPDTLSDSEDELGLDGPLPGAGAAADDIGVHAGDMARPGSQTPVGPVTPVTVTVTAELRRDPGSPRDGNFCEAQRLPGWYLESLPDSPPLSFREWSFSVTAQVARTGSQPFIDVNDL